jgi:hypothetical protein
MIKIFCDFRQFLAKKLALFLKTNVLIKNLQKLAPHKIAKFVSENILKIITPVRDKYFLSV